VFTTYILPMMFALLGTLIGAFRAILNRISISELAPRDFVRMLLGIPTGLVAGIAVGLSLSPTSVPIQGSGGVAGQLTLTASGLGFLAGYASQSFFTYLDNVMGTVFPNTADTNVPRPAANLRT
jgi:putative Mn2+ efflux pump MntP